MYRTKEGEPADAPKSWQQLRKGVADLDRRAEVSHAANHRLAESLASVAEPSTLGDLLKPLGRPVLENGRRRARALNPLTGRDGTLLRALAQGDFLLQGFRNRDVRAALCREVSDAAQRRRQAAAVTRQLALLRAHGVIVRVQRTHRSQLSWSESASAVSGLCYLGCSFACSRSPLNFPGFCWTGSLPSSILHVPPATPESLPGTKNRNLLSGFGRLSRTKRQKGSEGPLASGHFPLSLRMCGRPRTLCVSV